LGVAQTHPQIREAALYGSAIHATVEHAGVAGIVAEYLRTRGFAVESVEPIPPSLEDVFVALVEARDAEKTKRAEGSGP
jgi:ABC-2 type transport system ATP-binding protein